MDTDDCTNNEDMEIESPRETATSTHVPRPYQYELFQHALEQNSILVLGTGSGKTFISIMLIRELSYQIRGEYPKFKRTVFIAPTVPLVHQQAKAIKDHTDLKVAFYVGSMNIDFWDDTKWDNEIKKHEVLVFSAQIFLDLVEHSRLPLSQVNLLIIDECHHAAGGHPMKEVMREYSQLKLEGCMKLPRILGMTACIVHKKIKQEQVPEAIHELEKTMDAVLVTASDGASVQMFSTNPKEYMIFFKKEQSISKHNEYVFTQLDLIISDINKRKDIDFKERLNIMKIVQNIIYVMSLLGDWCGYRAIQFEIDHIKNIIISIEIPQVGELYKLLSQRLAEVSKFCLGIEDSFLTINEHITNKVSRLVEILKKCKSDSLIIIFVDRRNTAKILYDLLKMISENDQELSYMKVEYVLGTNNKLGSDFYLSSLELRKQKEVIERFNKCITNVLVSTSVLEEGLDIRKCNCVIRFDIPMNFRSYVQSKGRARAFPSCYVLLEEESNMEELFTDINLYKEMEEYLNTVCHNRSPPTLNEIQEHFGRDLMIPSYAPYGFTGPKITMKSAISLLARYCNLLPQDKSNQQGPEFKIVNLSGQSDSEYDDYDFMEYEGPNTGDSRNIICELTLPSNAPYKKTIMSSPQINVDFARRSAALKMCEILHKMGELNELLIPVKKKMSDIR